MRLLEYCSYRLAHAVIVPNESFKKRAFERGGCPSEKVFVVRNGPNLKYYRSCELTSEPFFPNKKRYVLAYLGRMGKQDGVENALYALHHLVYMYGQRDVSAIFIGSGSALRSLQALAHQLELDEHVFWAGWLEMRDVLSYLAMADIGLLPDPQNGLNEFCTMLKPLDYMAMGLPFVAFDLAETRVSAGDAALYAKPNDIADFARQLELLLTCEELRHSMGVVGRKRVVEMLSWEHSSKNLLAVYETLFPCEKGVESEGS